MTDRKWFAILFVSNALFFGWGVFWGSGAAKAAVLAVPGYSSDSDVDKMAKSYDLLASVCFQAGYDSAKAEERYESASESTRRDLQQRLTTIKKLCGKK